MSAIELFRLLDADRRVETVHPDVLRFCRQSGETGAFELPSGKDLLCFRVIVSALRLSKVKLSSNW